MRKRFRSSVLGLTGLALVVLALIVWAVGGVIGKEPALLPNDLEVVETGRQLYTKQCASCHGVKLEGQPNWRERKADGRLPAPPHDQTGHTWHHADAVLFDLTKYGPAAMAGQGYQSDMPGYETVLSDSEIIAVLSYIKSQWPAPIQARHDRLNAAQSQ